MSAGIVFQQMVIIFLLIMTGYTLYKKEIITGDIAKGLSALVVNVCNPALLVKSVFTRDASVTNDKLLLALAGSVVLYAVLILSSFVIPWLLHAEKKWKNHYAMMCIFGNTGFIGIPLVSAVLGSQALIYLTIVNASFNVVFYTYGLWLAEEGDSHFSWKNFLNMGNLSLVVTLLIYFLQPSLPVILTSTIEYMANSATFLAMIVVGVSLAKSDIRAMLKQWKMYVFIVLRFLLLPILTGLLLRTFIKDNLVYGVMLLMAAVPVANLPLMRVEEQGGDGQVLSNGIIMSTILSLITIPIVVMFV